MEWEPTSDSLCVRCANNNTIMDQTFCTVLYFNQYANMQYTSKANVQVGVQVLQLWIFLDQNTMFSSCGQPDQAFTFATPGHLLLIAVVTCRKKILPTFAGVKAVTQGPLWVQSNVLVEVLGFWHFRWLMMPLKYDLTRNALLNCLLLRKKIPQTNTNVRCVLHFATPAVLEAIASINRRVS